MYYLVHGLKIHSEIPLPELIHYEGAADVSLNIGKVNFPEDEPILTGSKFKVYNDVIYLFWAHIGRFKLENGCRIILDPLPGVDEIRLREIILGPVLAVLIHQRGHLVLHSSAADINNQAVAFLGVSGTGKSTAALSMHLQGYPIVTDDVLGVKFDEGPMAIPSFPGLKLSEDIYSYLKKEFDPQIQMPTNPENSFRKFSKGFPTKPLNLKNIYILKEDSFTHIEPLKSQNAFLKLLRTSYCASLFLKDDKALNLKQCGILINEIPIKYLKVPRSLKKLPEIAKAVEKDVLNG